jgi:hypothetical protein
LSYGLASGDCVDAHCSAVIQLLSGTKLLDSVPLDFAASDATLIRHDGETGLFEESGAAWKAGKEESAVITAIQPIKLTSNRTGLLVHQVAGFEHIKRRHDLYIITDTKLKRVWSAADGVGPAWSAAEVMPADIGQADSIIYLEGFRPGGAEADTLIGRRLAWDEAKQELTERPLALLPAIRVGEFPNAEVARQAAAGSCLAEYWALPADRFGGPPSKVVLAFVAPGNQRIKTEMARPCEPGPVRRVAEFHAHDS